MTTTLLAVDDSVTMRKVLELTFAGENFRVVTADSADAALAKFRSERPALVLADVTLEGTNGYTLCQKIKAESPSTPVIILSSRQQPYDVAKGSAAKADDYIDKPFDTQQLIDKVKKALGQPVGAAVSPFASSRSASNWKAVSVSPPRPTSPAAPAGLRHTPPPGSVAAVPPSPSASLAQGPRRTLSYTTDTRSPTASRPSTSAFAAVSSPAVPPRIPSAAPSSPSVPSSSAPVGPSPRPPAASPAPIASPAKPASVPAATAATTAASAPAASVALPADLSAKLGELGLTQAQIAGVLALSREVIEKVVWEVVPVLAETMIKEEIARLTAE